MSINHVNISGNLTRDAELRANGSGTSVLSFGVAVNDRRKNQQTGEWEDVPNFLDCVLFGTRAEKLAQYLVKGTKVAIDGKLRWSQWERNGQKRSKVEIVVDDIELMGSRSQQAPQQPQQAHQYRQQPQYQQTPQQAAQPVQGNFYDQDIPF